MNSPNPAAVAAETPKAARGGGVEAVAELQTLRYLRRLTVNVIVLHRQTLAALNAEIDRVMGQVKTDPDPESLATAEGDGPTSQAGDPGVVGEVQAAVARDWDRALAEAARRDQEAISAGFAAFDININPANANPFDGGPQRRAWFEGWNTAANLEAGR